MSYLLKTMFTEIMFLFDLKDRFSDDTIHYLKDALKLALRISYIVATAFSIYYGIECLTTYWNQDIRHWFGLRKAYRADIITPILLFYITKWTFYRSPRFEVTYDKTSVEDHIENLTSKGILLLISLFTLNNLI